MRSFVKSIFSKLGYTLSRTGGGYKIQNNAYLEKKPLGGLFISTPPVANFDNIALVMEYFTKARTDATFVQIGANDGETSDSVNSFVKMGVLRSYLVEPIPDNFRKLQQFYGNTPNVVFINAAIGQTPGLANIYSVKNKGRWYDNAWATQLASFDKNHLIRHGIALDEIEAIQIEAIDLPGMIEKYKMPRIDVLQIDVEGFDAEIVEMALTLKEPPLCICFEYVQFIKTMDQAAVNAFYERLRSKGYRWSHDRINTMAIHDSFVSSADGEPVPDILVRSA